MWEGKPFNGKFPPDVEFAMDPDFPDNTILTDSLQNNYNLIVASDRLADFFEKFPVPLVERLSVAIRNHKGNISCHYNLLNPLNAVDCLDYEASGAVTSKVIKTQVITAKRLVLRDSTIDNERLLFRIAGYPKMRLVRSDFAEALLTAGFTGIRFQEIDKPT